MRFTVPATKRTGSLKSLKEEALETVKSLLKFRNFIILGLTLIYSNDNGSKFEDQNLNRSSFKQLKVEQNDVQVFDDYLIINDN
jgi:hypothetical protein